MAAPNIDLLPKFPSPWPEGADADLQTYTGSCHCKTVRFEFDYPGLYSLPVVQCNCTICESRGYLNIYTANDHFKFTAGEESVKVYKYASERVIHRFCIECGTGFGATLPGVFAVINARSIDEVDIPKLLENVKQVDRKSVYM